MKESTPEFKEKYGYWRDREARLREIACSNPDSLALEAANQIKRLKEENADLIKRIELNSEILIAILNERNGLQGSDFFAIECLLKNNQLATEQNKDHQ